MPYALIVNKDIHFESLNSLNNFSIFKMVLFELISYKKEFYIIAHNKFYDTILNELNENNYLINNNVNLITYEENLNNYEITFLLTNLIFREIRLIPLDDYKFDNLYKMKKFNLKIKKKIYWTHPVYVLKSNFFRSKFLIEKNYKFCMIEYFLRHKKTELELFFNKIVNDYYKYNVKDINIDLINKIKKYDHYKLVLYKFN